MNTPAIISILFFIAASLAPNSAKKIEVVAPGNKSFEWTRTGSHWNYNSQEWMIYEDKVVISETGKEKAIVNLNAQARTLSENNWIEGKVLYFPPFGQLEKSATGYIFQTRPESKKNSVFHIEYK